MLVALIPARSGSKRVPGKNTRELAGHPLLAYTIAAARDAGCFGQIWVSTDALETVQIAKQYGADAFMNDPQRHADDAPDFGWIERLLRHLPPVEAFAILRPTSPFRLGVTIAQAWAAFRDSGAHSLRAVRRVTEHPGKMWILREGRLLPLLPWEHDQPWHSKPTQTLPPVYVQTSALELAWVQHTIAHGSISGTNVLPWTMAPPEDFSIDTEADWAEAERLVARLARLPKPTVPDGVTR